MRRHATAGRTIPPVRMVSAGLSQVRGRAPFGHAFGPHRGDRSPRWIYPNLIYPGTPCRKPVSPVAWIAAGDAHAVTWARKNGFAGHTVRQAQPAVRAVLHALSRKKRIRNRTQGTFCRRATSSFEKSLVWSPDSRLPARPFPRRRLLCPARSRAFDLLGTRGVDRVSARRTRRLTSGRGRSGLDGFCVWIRPAGTTTKFLSVIEKLLDRSVI